MPMCWVCKECARELGYDRTRTLDFDFECEWCGRRIPAGHTVYIVCELYPRAIARKHGAARRFNERALRRRRP